MPWLARRSEPPQVTLFTRDGCCLCDDALASLRKCGVEPVIIDVDSAADLRERFTDCVPVIAINGRERFRGRISEVLLRRELRAARRESDQ